VLLERLRDAAGGGELPAEGVLPPDADAETALRADGVRGASARTLVTAEGVAEAMPPAKGPSTEAGVASTPVAKDEAMPAKRPTSDSTIRVEVGRLEALMNLVGELVLEKNRIGAIARKLAHAIGSTHHELSEQAALAAGGLDRIAADIQTAVMRTRLQPLDKLFGKYPRLIRDLAGKTGKKIELVIEGGETEVDRSVIEELGDPLVHLLRNAADHGLELPDERVKRGKNPTGTITLRASHQGSHVKIEVADDGRGLSRERIVAKAVERGLVSAEMAATMDDRAIYPFIFEPGFSTAEKVSDLSGRGVGMDVVRTNIARIKGAIDLSSTPGLGTTVSITIPLTLAILPAMMVEVKGEVYAIPLDHVVEIVKPSKEQVSTIGSTPVLRLRDAVLPLVSAVEAFGLPQEEGDDLPFAVILDMNQRRAGLRVGSLIGQHDIVIKPLDGVSRDGTSEPNPVSGATVRDDGGVSLIVDVASLLRSVEDVKSPPPSDE
jgi:two-component system chemotaxis sensor kinase CheA